VCVCVRAVCVCVCVCVCVMCVSEREREGECVYVCVGGGGGRVCGHVGVHVRVCADGRACVYSSTSVYGVWVCGGRVPITPNLMPTDVAVPAGDHA
jgi:hypothetical protein